MLRKMQIGMAAIALAALLGAPAAEAAPKTALYLTMDGSGSIDSTEFTTQINGYTAALNTFFSANPLAYGEVAIGGGIFGANFAEFFPVTEITNSTTLGSLITAINGLDPGRAGIDTGSTAIGDAITASANALTTYNTSLGGGLKLLIDVTTDGQNNSGSNPATVAAALTPSPISAVNCLGIGAGADCSFVGSSGTDFGQVSFANLGGALANKLQVEVVGVPEPTAMAVLGAGLVALGLARRRRAA